MLKRYGFGFYEVAFNLERLRSSARLHAVDSGSYSSPKQLYETAQQDFRKFLACMIAECDILELAYTSEQASFINAEFKQKDKNYSYNDLLKDLDHLAFSFGNELRKNISFRIADSKKDYFQKDDLFGLKVNLAFPSCLPEIESAGNCYALEQDDAAVFHLMRVLERSLGVLAKKFGVDFSHTNWHNVIEEVEKKIRKMDSSFGADWKEQQKFCAQAATHFMFLKEAWRNHVMHVRDVPYDEGRSLSIFSHVREFMQALAEGGLKDS